MTVNLRGIAADELEIGSCLVEAKVSTQSASRLFVGFVCGAVVDFPSQAFFKSKITRMMTRYEGRGFG